MNLNHNINKKIVLRETVEINKEKLIILERLRTRFEKSEDIVSARVYGSWLHSDKSKDLDICLMVPSIGGVVDSEVYRRLKEDREELGKETGQDVDLVPHTQDEISDHRSDLYYPRNNPALVSGRDIKGHLDIKPIFDKDDQFSYSDLTAHILLGNRTVCRRQIVRSMLPEEAKIFASKLLHGPGNALTYYACKQKMQFLASPSNLSQALGKFDQIFNVNTKPSVDLLMSSRKELKPENAPRLLKWYEHLTALVLGGEKFSEEYNKYCLELSKA